MPGFGDNKTLWVGFLKIVSGRSSSRDRRMWEELPPLLSSKAVPAWSLSRRGIHILFLSHTAVTHTYTVAPVSDESFTLHLTIFISLYWTQSGPNDNSTLSSVKSSGEFMAKKCRSMESMEHTTGQNRKIKTYWTHRTEKTRNYSEMVLWEEQMNGNKSCSSCPWYNAMGMEGGK